MATVADLAARVVRRLGLAAVAAADRPALSVTAPVADIALAALRWLGVVAADETPSAADQALAEAKVAAVHESLVAQGSVPWASSAIPRSVSEDYVMLAALHLGPSFGKAGDAAQEAVRERRVRQVALLMGAPALAEQAVLDVHTHLEARGKVRWSCQDIPDQAEEAYVSMACFLLAPAFGIVTQPAEWARGERLILQVISLPTSGDAVVGSYF